MTEGGVEASALLREATEPDRALVDQCVIMPPGPAAIDDIAGDGGWTWIRR